MPEQFHLAVLNSHPIQYFAPLYAYVNASPDIKITALYLSDVSVKGEMDKGFGQVVKWDVDLLSGYNYRFVGAAAGSRKPDGFFSLVAPEIWRIVQNGGFDALLLHGHNYAANHIALMSAKLRGLPVFMRCESHLGLARSAIKASLRRPLLTAYYGLFDALLAIGSANREFYQYFGVPKHKISLVPYTVDNARFARDARLAPEQRQEIRHSLGIRTGLPAVVFASKLERRKRPDDLIRAAQRLTQQGLDFDLVIVGSGDLEEEIKSLVKSHGPKNTVFPGFINQHMLPKVLGACDVFVLPSENEPWGLVVNEALCAGLPIIVSTDVGCGRDLLRAGENGFVFETGNVDKLAEALQHIIESSELRGSMSEASRRIIAGWSYQECLEGLREALVRTRHGRGPLDFLLAQE
jgi:glycosyltransferase involved in cell wall biosynthesis